LVEADALFELEYSDCFQKAQSAQSVRIGGIFRRLKAHLNVALRGKIVDFRRLSLLHEADEIGCVCHIAVVQKELCTLDVRIDVKVIDALGVERRRAPLEAVHDIAFPEQ
jgi:hypothetical protein